MSWRERAVVAEAPTEVPTGSWRDRAAPDPGGEVDPNELPGGAEPVYSAGGLARNAAKNVGRLINPIGIAKGLGETIHEGAYAIPRDLTQSLAQKSADLVTGQTSGPTPAGDRMRGIAESQTVQEPVRWAYENPIDAAGLVAAPAAPFLKARPILRRGAPAPVRTSAPATAPMAAPAEMPVVAPTQTGAPYAVFDYHDPMLNRPMFKIYGDPAKHGYATTPDVPLEVLKEKGIPITGRTQRSVDLGHKVPESLMGEPAASAPAVAPPASATVPVAAAGAMEPKPMNILQRLGTKGVNSQAGISPETVEAMTRSGQNPAEIGGMLGKRLVDEKVLGQSPGETFSKVMAKKQEYGKAVDDAMAKIREANRSTGEWENVEDALHVNANTALKPLLDKKVALANSPFSASKRMARPWTEAYTYLANEANAAPGGMLTLDHVNGAMQHVGNMFRNLEKGTESYKNVARLYGALANVRDGMVSDIASRLGNPALAENLIKANQGYSFYSRISPDISWQAAADAVGGPEMSLTGTVVTEAKPILARTAVKAGGVLQRPSSIFRRSKPGA